MLSRRAFLSTSLSATISAAAVGQPSTRPPNIVLVLTDDQGYGDIAVHGNPVIKTPNLDHLHAQSRRFTEFHVSPTCSPTRTAIQTGRHEFRSGVTHTILERERMNPQAATLASVLQKAGYQTGIFGKWHMGDGDEYQPQRRGFHEAFIHGCGGIGQDYPGTCSDAPGNTYFDPIIRHNGVFERTRGYCTDVFFQQALHWIEEQKKGPFFAMITPNAPHAPLFCPEEYQRIYRGQGLDEATEKYFGMCTNIDDNVGRLMSRLNQWGLDRNTVLIFMTDNGGTGGVKVFNDGMRGMKNTPYRGGTRVPAFFRWPGVITPGDTPALAAHIDMFPTLAEIAGAPAANGLDGRSLVPLLKDPKAGWADRFLFTHIGRWPAGGAAEAKYAGCRVRNARWSMVSKGPAKSWELYDLANDPGESKQVDNPAVAAELERAYDQWWASVLPALVNENAVPPRVAPYKQAYWKQFGGGPGVLPQ